MIITLLNGNPLADNESFDGYLQALIKQLELLDHKGVIFPLREMNIKHCIGCFGCWIKTPGYCIVRDDTSVILERCINSDLVLLASPIIMGFTSALLKKVLERFLPFLLPYFDLVDGEVHHMTRYDKFPLLGLLLEKGGDTDQMDIDIITDIYRRNAINFKTKLSFVGLNSEPIEETANGIGRI